MRRFGWGSNGMSLWGKTMACALLERREKGSVSRELMCVLVSHRRVEGKRYFQTAPLCASFVRPDKVTVGDFPELDPFAEDDDEMEM
jgi:hypothetical protein